MLLPIHVKEKYLNPYTSA